MKIKWYGTASLLIDSGSTRLLIDPYLKEYSTDGMPFPMEEALSARAIFITHPHMDHFKDIGAFVEAGKHEIYVSQNGIDHAKAYGVNTDGMIPIGANERYIVGDITVRIFRSKHCNSDLFTLLRTILSPRTLFHPKRTHALFRHSKQFPIKNDVFALDISAGGKSVMVLGSAGLDENIEYPDGADLMVLPYQGRVKMHRYILSILRAFEPKCVMIDHFDNAFPSVTHRVNTKKFIPTVKKAFPDMQTIIPKQNEWYEV